VARIELPEVDYSAKGNEGIAQIGRNVATLIEDGATLQMGIGAIPDQVLTNLGNHKNLGIHTEMFSDGIIPLLEKGLSPTAIKGSMWAGRLPAFWQARAACTILYTTTRRCA
jgi:acyl-CoA hydrolase